MVFKIGAQPTRIGCLFFLKSTDSCSIDSCSILIVKIPGSTIMASSPSLIFLF